MHYNQFKIRELQNESNRETVNLDTLKDTTQFSDDDDSGGSCSDDNLKELDLYSKVYMKKSKSIERKMRQTNKAQKNFIQEVKILIKKKDEIDDGADEIQDMVASPV